MPSRIVFPAVLMLTLPLAGVTDSPKALIGPLADPGVIDGCSWSATSSATGKAIVFLAEYDESVAVMNIDGQDVQLKLEGKASKGSLAKVGNRLHRQFLGISKPVVVDADFVVTWRCPPKDESCEVTRFTATFTARLGTRVQSIRGEGDVGC